MGIKTLGTVACDASSIIAISKLIFSQLLLATVEFVARTT